MKTKMLENVYCNQKNLLVAGDITAGKTTDVLFPLVDRIIEEKESLAILDCKKEYINHYYKKLKENHYNIIVLNLRDCDSSDGWNPLAYPYQLYQQGAHDQAIDYLEKMAKTIYYENAETADPFWSLTASDFFVGVVLGLFEDAKASEINLASVNAMFEGINQKNGAVDYLTSYFELKDPNAPSYLCASSTVFSPKETKGSILSVARQRLKTYISRPKLSMLMNQTTFAFEDIGKKPTAILVIAKDESKNLSSIASIFIEQLSTMLCSRNETHPFYFVLDNFDVIENINEFSDMLGAGLTKGIRYIVATRSLEDLLRQYGAYMTKLSDQIYVGNDALTITMNGAEKSCEKQYEKREKKSGEVEYPHLRESKVNVFDLKRYVQRAEQDDPSNCIMNSEDSQNNIAVDALIKKIEGKLAKLEEQNDKK